MCMCTDQTLLWMYKLRTKLPASTHMSQIGCCIYTCTYSKHLHNRVAGRVASYVHNSINKLKPRIVSNFYSVFILLKQIMVNINCSTPLLQGLNIQHRH